MFGIQVFATAKTSDGKVLHAANVLAQYLNNYEDGVPDNPDVVAQMRRICAAIVMSATERDRKRANLEFYTPRNV